jgi:hypothetical protein
MWFGKYITKNFSDHVVRKRGDEKRGDWPHGSGKQVKKKFRKGLQRLCLSVTYMLQFVVHETVSRNKGLFKFTVIFESLMFLFTKFNAIFT